ncbi:ExeA family protein [Roseibium aestuarii]|uniref:ExeA family protein n=1 Tax=Roseibium aestuarii TaxID=2600299 RepID=A0ABW4JU45_9HYPH|nr:AAA family ATPase [Roseibium aestuarii]
MYEPFYSLLRKPFALIPDPRFIYWGGPHSMAYAMLEYGIVNHAGFTVITGEVGAGKTTLIQHLLDKLPGDICVGLLSNTGGGGELLEWVLMAFDQEFDGGSRVVLFKRFKDFLTRQYELGRRTVLIVDEAQNLGAEALEELRMLTNVNSHARELLQIVLSGQPELKELLASPSMKQFVQRVSSDFHLPYLSKPDEVASYIDHRLRVAGAKRTLFTPEASEMIFHATQGTPRLINLLCDTALLYGYSTEAPEIGREIVERVLEDKRRFGVFPMPGEQKVRVAT